MTIDTSTIDEVRNRLHREAANKAKKFNGSINLGLNLGTTKNLNSILKRASNKGKVIADKLEAERLKRKEAKKNRDIQK